MRSGRRVTVTWHSAPPVSLPTSVTSSRPSSAIASPIRSASAYTDRSAFSGIGSVCAPSGMSSVMQRKSGESFGTTLRQRFAFTSRPCTNTIGAPLPAS